MCSFSFTLYIQILFLCTSRHFQPKNPCGKSLFLESCLCLQMCSDWFPVLVL
ncbi:hypothetical protein M758_4G012600 [Ceratodon purpureus]|uniref:Uncharacterized protein n=1 Tax=Ceratodon purpureus TaxID=3225 RepID=A0A8T0I5D2_CERPU|nr:hypothetical protein KC19_4G013800 [Ceratodon purpureus]KAG0617755.1 hypothetical protein M758_4G012600 [Ceratodon purpureus]